MKLEAGQFSYLAWLELRKTLAAERGATEEVTNSMLMSDSWNQRLLGLYLQLELFGYSNELADYALRQDSVLFVTRIIQWLYLNQDFKNYTELTGKFLESMTTKQQAELFSYLVNTQGARTLPATFSLLNLGRLETEDLQRLIYKSRQLQAALRAHLLEGEISTHTRNTGLTLLKATQSPELTPTIEHFMKQYPAESRTSLYLIHLRDRSDGISETVLLSHERTIQANGLSTNEGIRSLEVVLKAIEAHPELKIENAVLDEMESYLQNQAVKTGKSREKLALIGYNRWLNQSK